MTDPAEARFNVTAEDLRAYDWQAVIRGNKRKQCSSFSSAFAGKAVELREGADDLGGRVFALLQVVASFHANYDAAGNPYGSMWTSADGERSLNAEDLTDEDLEALAGVVDEIEDPEYRARVADLLWVTKKNYKAAKLAVIAFLESAERLKPIADNYLWPPYAERLDRATRISAKRGFEEERASVQTVIETAINEYQEDLKTGLTCHRLMELLLYFRIDDAAHYAALSEKLALGFAGIDDWRFSDFYWKLAARWHELAKDPDEAKRCRIEAAECLVTCGEKCLGTSSATNAAHWVGQGFDALRRAGADKARIDEVHRLYVKLEKASLADLHPIEVDVDALPGFREKEASEQARAENHVRGHSVEVAIRRFANIIPPTKYNSLKEQFIKNTEHSLMHTIFGATMLDGFGQVADRLEPCMSPGAEDGENLRKSLTDQARKSNWPIMVTWYLQPARLVILDEHAIRLDDLRLFVEDNPFVAPGHENIYARGLQAGFHGDWLVAMHLLVPQVEASIRFMLRQEGFVTSKTESDGKQKEYDLNYLLWMPEVEEMLGEDILFDLRGILIERFGHNMRNASAHGLMPEGQFYQPASVYLWWLILRLCWLGYTMAKHQDQQQSEDGDGTTGDC
jgi:hypothetical protein